MKKFPYHRIVVPLALLALAVGTYIYFHREYRIRIEQGATVANVSGTDASGQAVSLYSLQNKLVLLQFWASWCGPCVHEIPGMKSVYEKYHAQSFRNADGFDVFACSLDFDTARWKVALQRFGIPWRYNMCDGKAFKSPVAQRFGVNAIPSNVLLDAQHRVIGVDLEPDELAAALEHQR